VYLSSLYRAERGTADALKALVSQSLDRRAFDAGKVTCWAEERLGLKFSEDRRQAVQMAVTRADIAREAGEFQLTDVLDSVNRKLVRRHPHVFGDVSVADAREVERNWERIKEQERQQKGQRKSRVDGIPKDLPALTYAQLMQDRVARVGVSGKIFPACWTRLSRKWRSSGGRPPMERKCTSWATCSWPW
jgi:hypothetical protein